MKSFSPFAAAGARASKSEMQTPLEEFVSFESWPRVQRRQIYTGLQVLVQRQA